MKKIVIVTTGLRNGGAERALYQLVIEASKKMEVYVVSLVPPTYYKNDFLDLPISLVDSDSNRFYFIKQLLQLYFLIRRQRPDAVQTWMYHADIFGGLVAKFAGANRIIWGVRSSVLRWGEAKATTLLLVKVGILLSRIIPDAIIFCSRVSLNAHLKIGYDKKKVQLINNSFRESEFHVMTTQSTNQKFFHLGFIGRFDPVKNIPLILQSTSECIHQGVPVRLSMCGTDISSENKNLLNLIRQKNLESHINLCGEVKNLRRLYNSMDLLIVGSLSESFPNVILEAKGCGCMAVSSDVGAAREIIGRYGLIVQSYDPLDFASAIKRIYSFKNRWSPQAWKKLRKKISRDAKLRYSQLAALSAYEQVWFPKGGSGNG
ncbi:glycosyltransferase [Litorivicinus sp.]|nr:glycosyltransferase [Litorivicinus sp.]